MMSMFYCLNCDNPRDADDGCEEHPTKNTELICQPCIEENYDNIHELYHNNNKCLTDCPECME